MTTFSQKFREAKNQAFRGWVWLRNTYDGRSAEHLAELKIRSRRRYAHLGYAGVFAFLLSLIIGRSHQPPLPNILPRTGEPAEQNFVSPLTINIETKEATPDRREEQARQEPPVFDYDDKIIPTWVDNWRQTFKEVRNEFYLTGKKVNLVAVRQRVLEYTGQNLKLRDLQYLHLQKFSPATESAFIKMAEFFRGKIIAASDLFPFYYASGIKVRQLNQRLNETHIQDVSRIWSLDQAREVLKHVPTMLKDVPADKARPLIAILSPLLQPNLIYNENLSRSRIDARLANTRPDIVSLREGQVFIKKGDRLSQQDLDILRSLRELTARRANLQRFVLTWIILFCFFWILFQMTFSGRGFWNISFKDALVFMGLTVATVVTVKLGYLLLQRYFSNLSDIYGLEYLIPISAGGIIIHLMMGKGAAYCYSLGTSVVIGYMLDQHFFFTVWAFTVNAAAIGATQSCKQRTDLFKAGLISGAVGAIVVAAFALINIMGFRNPDWVAILITVTLAFISGILSTVLTSTLIPFVESVFGYTTSLKLLELSNFNHPLLHNLMMKAPGTYHHSVIVGSLAELAADKVGADSILARVSAYYHDIGKMTKPLYFIENQSPNNNPHDQLAPSMSAKILFAHVKNGVRLGREHHLGDKIVDIIEQHHGTTITSYFFNKAKQMADPGHEHCEENHYRYPGPKPQTREAGIVMLADACEAATRSIADPTPAKIQGMVHSIIQKRLLEDQFSDCDLTQKDLAVIEDTFTRTLVSLYHHRIEYPGQKNHQASETPKVG